MLLRLSPYRIFLLAALALLALAGCARAPKLQQLAPGAVVLAYGDSLTYGTGAGNGETYPEVLQRLIGRSVVAAGVPGEGSADGLARLPLVLAQVHPQLLLLCHGGNDFLRRGDDAVTAANLRAMVRLAREQGVEVVLIGTPKPGLILSAPAFYAEIAREFGLPYEAAALKTVLADNGLKSDLIHPNAQGYARVAGAVADLLRKAGAV